MQAGALVGGGVHIAEQAGRWQSCLQCCEGLGFDALALYTMQAGALVGGRVHVAEHARGAAVKAACGQRVQAAIRMRHSAVLRLRETTLLGRPARHMQVHSRHHSALSTIMYSQLSSASMQARES